MARFRPGRHCIQGVKAMAEGYMQRDSRHSDPLLGGDGRSQGGITRRRFVRLLGSGAAASSVALLLAACQAPAPANPAAAAPTTGAAAATTAPAAATSVPAVAASGPQLVKGGSLVVALSA